MHAKYKSCVEYVACKFFPFVARLFIFLRESFTEHKFLILMRFSLSTFPFMDCGFGVKYKNSSPKSPRFFFFLLSKSF